MVSFKGFLIRKIHSWCLHDAQLQSRVCGSGRAELRGGRSRCSTCIAASASAQALVHEQFGTWIQEQTLGVSE